VADAAVVVLLESQHPDGAAEAAAIGPAGQPSDLRRRRAEIDQATGMVSAQLDVAIGGAVVRLRAYAYAQNRRLSDVARDIVARRLRLTPDGTFPGTVKDKALPAREPPGIAAAAAAWPFREVRRWTGNCYPMPSSSSPTPWSPTST